MVFFSMLSQASYLLLPPPFLSSTSPVASSLQPVIFSGSCLCPLYCSPATFVITSKTIKIAPNDQPKYSCKVCNIITAVTIAGFCLSSALCGNDGKYDGKSFLLRHFFSYTEISHRIVLCVVELRQAMKCVWTSEQSSTYSTLLRLCANERSVCEGCKGLSHWLTLPYAWNNFYTHQVAVAPRSPELRCHLRNTACFCCSLHAADCQPNALPIMGKTKTKNHSTASMLGQIQPENVSAPELWNLTLFMHALFFLYFYCGEVLSNKLYETLLLIIKCFDRNTTVVPNQHGPIFASH